MARHRKRKKLPDSAIVTIEGLSHEGRGITHINGKTVFVFAALAGEEVEIEFKKTNSKYDEAITTKVLKASPARIKPACDAFEVCGGCSFQHLHNEDQVEHKQQTLFDNMRHAGVEIDEVIPAIRSKPWGYRKKARLGVKFVKNKGRVLVGFRERSTPFLADMSSCEVLIPEVGAHFQRLVDLIEQLDARETIPQIEVAADHQHVVLVFRHLEPLSDKDTSLLTQFAKNTGLWLQLQPAGPNSIRNLYPLQQALYFSPLENTDIKINFSAVDFIQVNSGVNQKMVAQALEYLDLQNSDRVLDLFCGLGNFTLPIAKVCAKVTGVEGDLVMVDRAKQNALANNIHNTEYYSADLTNPDAGQAWMGQTYDKILIDPPRSGALEIAGLIKKFNAERLVYVSCQPSSLVRDAKIICQQGYRLSHLGIMDMFPQTAHVESMAVFTRGK